MVFDVDNVQGYQDDTLHDWHLQNHQANVGKFSSKWVQQKTGYIKTNDTIFID